jgi:hypothetical protein
MTNKYYIWLIKSDGGWLELVMNDLVSVLTDKNFGIKERNNLDSKHDFVSCCC